MIPRLLWRLDCVSIGRPHVFSTIAIDPFSIAAIETSKLGPVVVGKAGNRWLIRGYTFDELVEAWAHEKAPRSRHASE